MRRMSVPLTLLAVVALITLGCGSANIAEFLNIGAGPGPMSSPVAPTPAGGVDITKAENAPFPDNPNPDQIQAGLLLLLQNLCDDPPDTAQEFQNLMDAISDLVDGNPNDPGSQFALALAILVSGVYNAALEVGMPPEDIFTILPDLLHPNQKVPAQIDLREIVSAPLQMMTTLHFMGPDGWDSAAAGVKNLLGPGEEITTAGIQIAIRRHLLPSLYLAIARIEAVTEIVDPPTDPLLEDIGGNDGWNIYPADVKLVLALMYCMQSALHELIAYQLNWGDWEPHDLEAMDVQAVDNNDDDLLTPDEYAPPDPFLWLHPAPNMQASGDAMKAAITALIWAVKYRGDDSLSAWIVDSQPLQPAELNGWLRDFRTILTERVEFRVDYDTVNVNGVAPAATTYIPMNFGAIYYDPIDDIKDLLPTFHIVCDEFDCWAELQSPNDFPDLTFNGVVPDPPAIGAILATNPNQVTISYNNIVIPLLDPNGPNILPWP